MTKLVEVLTEEKQIHPLGLGHLRIYMCWSEVGEEMGGGKGDKRIIHGYSQPWSYTHVVQGPVQPAGSVWLWAQSRRPPGSQQPRWFGQEDGHTLGAKIYLSSTNPLHHHAKRVALGATTFPVPLPNHPLPRSTTYMSQPSNSQAGTG